MITHAKAAEIAALWGSFVHNGDPGAIFYAFPEQTRAEWLDDTETREHALAYCETCLSIARERVSDCAFHGAKPSYAQECHDDVANLASLREYIVGAGQRGVFVESFDVTSLRDFLLWAREDHDPLDQWGWALSWLFDIASALELRGAEVPPELQYSSGAGGPYVSEDREEGLAEFPTEVLQRGALVLNRFADRLRAAGHDY